jgi:hypothetical protein
MDNMAKIVMFASSVPLTMILLRKLSHFRASHHLVRKMQMTVAAEPSSQTKHSVAHLRKEYSRQGLLESANLQKDGPLALFNVWLKECMEAKVLEPNAMCLSTCENNRPSARFVLLKGVDEKGFVWFTNYHSRKSQQLTESGCAALTFWCASKCRFFSISVSVLDCVFCFLS